MCPAAVDTKPTEPNNLADLLDDRSHFGMRKDCRGAESYKLRRFATSTRLGKSVFLSAAMMMSLRMVLLLMNVGRENKSMRPRPTPLAQWRVSLALLCAAASPTPSFSQGTAEQRLACTPDVLRLCSEFIPNAGAITNCLREKDAELSDPCRTALEAGTNQLPSTNQSTGARKRTAR